MKIYSHYNACICVVLSSMLFCVTFISLRVSIKDVDTCVVVAAAATATAVVPHTPKFPSKGILCVFAGASETTSTPPLCICNGTHDAIDFYSYFMIGIYSL